MMGQDEDYGSSSDDGEIQAFGAPPPGGLDGFGGLAQEPSGDFTATGPGFPLPFMGLMTCLK